MNYVECKKEFVKTMNSIGRSSSRWDVLTDFATMARCAIINNSTPFKSEDYEKQYLQTVGKYSKEEAVSFSHMLALVYMAQRDNDGDFLGECLMELDMGSKDLGQFFTPYDLCSLSARMTMQDIPDETARKGYVTLQEPAAGGGAMVIAAKAYLRDERPEVELFAVCTELSSLTADLCYINLTASGVAAQVINGNTLSMEVYRTMPTPQLCSNVWSHRLSFAPVDEMRTTVHITPQDEGPSIDTGLSNLSDVSMMLGEDPWLVCSERLHVFKDYVATDYVVR
ncbi:hypothetical protein VPHK389_0040 [Vibrio phage K389]|nr:hypothetical protein SIPHO010v1_p0059 [Vibrio phage 268E42.1]